MTTVYMEVDRKIYTNDMVPFAKIGSDWLMGKMLVIYPQGKQSCGNHIYIEIEPFVENGIIQGHTGAGYGLSSFDNSDEMADLVRNKYLNLLERLTGANEL